jgi:integrase
MSTAAVKITDPEIKRQASGTVRDLRDVENKGLYLRFGHDRTRPVWYLVRKRRWSRIGAFPDLTTKQVVAALPGIRLRVEEGARTALSRWETTGELLDWYADRMSKDRNLSAKRKKTSASAIKCHLGPRLGDTRLIDITKATLDTELMWPLQETLSIDYVRLVFQLLALAFRQAYRLGLITANPMKDIKFSDFSKARVGIKPSRLRGAQLSDLLAQLSNVFETNPKDAMLALLMLCHGTRIGESRLAQWPHMALSEREWFLPAADTKTRVEHHLPLTEQVCAILIRYREWQHANGYDGQYLFPGRNGKPLSEGQASAVFARLGGGEWTSHDLRKVARTGWADIGIDHLIGELLINHAMGHNVKVYIQSDVMSRKRDALERWHALLDSKGLNLIHKLTEDRFGDSGNPLEATANKGCESSQESTIGEVSKA